MTIVLRSASLLLLLWLGVRFAQAEIVTTNRGIFDQLALEYSNTLSGPALSDPTSGTHFDDEAEGHKGSLEMEHAALAGYRFTPDISLGAVTRWKWFSRGRPVQLMDPYLRLGHGKLLSAGNFNMEADLRLSAPVSEESRNRGLFTSLASEQVFSYELQGSRFALGLTTFTQWNLHAHDGDQEGDLLELHLSPGLEYKISDSLLASAVYELSRARSRFSEVMPRQPEGSLVEVGLVWNVAESLKFNPSVHTRTNRPLAAESFTLGAKVNWVLL